MMNLKTEEFGLKIPNVNEGKRTITRKELKSIINECVDRCLRKYLDEENFVTLDGTPVIQSTKYPTLPPEDSCMDVENGWCDGEGYKCFKYFGDCRNTVDKDKMWNASQMAQWLSSVKLIKTSKIIDRLSDGDRKIPIRLNKILSEHLNRNSIDNLENIVSGIDDYQKILVIYCTKN